MASIDSTVASIIDAKPPGECSDDDDLFDSLENDPCLESFREQRLQQLHDEISRAKHLRNQEHGIYTEIKDEKSLMDIVNTMAELCVVHFFKSDFQRCGIMDIHLEKLAPVHFDTRFLRINVENAPFLVSKLKVQVLPCVIAFRKGVSVDRIIGFEGLGQSEDTFATRDLEQRLLVAGVLVRQKLTGTQDPRSAKQRGTTVRKDWGHADSDDEDWD
ncbi:MAG: hypothetical protein LQ351_002422 [Letrouitia transgressa]|nr:MAG: hypothetical protein LQ351_002422 [Letrouitia transgressa]